MARRRGETDGDAPRRPVSERSVWQLAGDGGHPDVMVTGLVGDS